MQKVGLRRAAACALTAKRQEIREKIRILTRVRFTNRYTNTQRRREARERIVYKKYNWSGKWILYVNAKGCVRLVAGSSGKAHRNNQLPPSTMCGHAPWLAARKALVTGHVVRHLWIAIIRPAMP